jgi:hypothetical protein
MGLVFIDSNVPMYAAGREHEHRVPAQQFLRRVESGEQEAVTSAEVLQEILYRFTALRQPEARTRTFELFLRICPNVLPVTLEDTSLALQLLEDHSSLSARDALHAAVMKNHGIEVIATFDKDFDAVAGIRRYRFAR